MRPLFAGVLALMLFLVSNASLEAQTSKPKDSTPPLIQALASGEYAKAKALIEKGANPNARDAGGLTPLMWAADQEQPEIVEMLLARGARVNDKDPGGGSALLLAVTHGDIRSTRALLNRGADPAVYVTRGELSPITVAASSGKVE